ncbi:MAG: T9SS type A sorting domain-containing protein [Bacteroidia bacterium]|nr:T9SS type A sorting domain-containing protein [Bacteroidia bacterium]
MAIGANSLNVGSGAGNVVINAPTAAISSTISLSTGSLTCGNITIGGGGTANWIGRINITGAATVNCTGVSFTGTAAQARFICAAGSFLKIGNSGTLGSGGTFTKSTGTVEFTNITGGQSVNAYSYHHLKFNNTSGINTATGNIDATGTITTTAGGTFDMSTFALSGAFTAANSGTFSTSNTSAAPVTTGKTWGGTFIYALTTGGQTVMTGTYNNLMLSNTSGTNTAAGALTVNGTLTIPTGGTLSMSTFALSGTLSSIINDGTIQTANTSATPLPIGKTWTGIINYNALAGQTVVSGTYNNLLLSGSLAKTLGGDITVNGMCTINGLASTALTISNRILTLNGGLTVTSGTLVGGNTSSLIMGATATLPSSLTGLLNLTLNNGTTTLSGPLTIVGATNTTGILNLNGGIVISSGPALLTVNNRTTGAIIGGSSTSYVDGPLQREFALNQTGSNVYPIGDAGQYLPFTLSSLSLTAGTQLRVEAFSGNSGGSAGSCVTSISTTEYWSATITTGTYTTGSVSIGRQSAIVSLDIMGKSATINGAYNSLGGSPSGNNINSSDLTGNTLGFFVMAVRTVTSPTLTTPTSANITVTTADLGANISSLGCAKVIERGIKYSTTNGFDPSISGTTISQTPGPYNTGTYSISITGLSLSTTYYYVGYAVNSDGTSYTPQGTFTTRTPKIYYVNDNSTTGDIFTTAVGNNAVGRGQTAATPKLTLTSLLSEYNASFLYGDTIKIDAGTYNNEVSLNFTRSGITFLGAGSTTIIDNLFAGVASNYFMYVTGSNVIFRNFVVTGYENNGTQTPGHSGQAFTVGGSASNVLFENMMLTNNGSSGGNPAITFLDNTTATLRGGGSFCNLFNTAWTGGIETFGDGITLNIENYVIGYNFKANSFDGGGLLMSGSGSISGTTVNITNTLFTTNEAAHGGGISQRGGVLNVSDCTIDQNYAGQTSTPIYGGGVRMTGGTATFTRTKFTNNALGGAGGTLRGGGIGLYSLDAPISLTLDNCYFSGNVAGEGNDIFADVFSSNGVTATATNTTFSTANFSIFNKDATITLTNCGNPPIGGANTPAVNKVNTTAPSSTPNPTPPYIVGDCANFVLPIELSKFEAQCEDNYIKLSWETLSELNNDKFYIEKSVDGIFFETIGQVNGSGNSSTVLKYSFIDYNYKNITFYYRLSQQDFDGTTTKSKIIKIEGDCFNNIGKEFVLYPNPSKEKLNLSIKLNSTADITLNIYNSVGDQIINIPQNSFPKGLNTLILETESLVPGVYYIHLIKDGIVMYDKFIKL